MTASPIRIAIVDDAEDLRLVCSLVFDADDRFEVVGTAGDGASALTLVDDEQPDVVLVDLGLPDVDGLELVAALTGRDERPVVVVLTGSAEPEGPDAGADGWFVKSGGPQRLVDPVAELYRAARIS